MNVTTNKITCRILSELLTAHGVEDVVLSPGSRNTPIILAFDSNQNLKKHVIIDERSAAYVALGIAKSSNKPVAIACTSGTALLNYTPAVAEAYYQSIPLIVISADRPAQWIDQDDSQTIRQYEALRNFVKKSYDIIDIEEEDEEMKWFANRTINDALLTSISERKGPVHLNIQLNEPLSKTIEKRGEKYRIIKNIQTSQYLKEDDLLELCNYINNKKILIVGGFYKRNERLISSLNNLSLYNNIKVLTETITNVEGNAINTNIDRTISPLSPSELNELTPDIVISFGGALVSRYVKQFLRSFKPLRHISIGYNHTTIDCFKSLTDKIEIAPESFFEQLSENLTSSKIDYAKKWGIIENKTLNSHINYLSNISWSDFKAFDIIINSINQFNEKFHLSVSNGTPIRYTQLFDIKNVETFSCNRGVSGIDGCTSTAIGIALAENKKTIFISGDMSFSYDIGALGINYIPKNLKIIVINNHGGGIFRFIKTTKDLSQREHYFSCQPNLPLRELCEAYNYQYYYAHDENTLKNCICDFLSSDMFSILEIETPEEESAIILNNYMNRKI